MKLTPINRQPLLITWLDFGGQRSKVKVTAGRRDGEDIHVDTEVSKFVF